MKIQIIILAFVISSFALGVKAQSPTLSLKQQNEDFTIFKGSLKEGHSGLYYFISKVAFDKKCDSIQNTFNELHVHQPHEHGHEPIHRWWLREQK